MGCPFLKFSFSSDFRSKGLFGLEMEDSKKTSWILEYKIITKLNSVRVGLKIRVLFFSESSYGYFTHSGLKMKKRVQLLLCANAWNSEARKKIIWKSSI